MSTDGDDPQDKGRTPPPSTLAGVVPQPPGGRPGLPPPRAPLPRPGSKTQQPPGVPAGAPPPFSQPQAPSPFATPPQPSPPAQSQPQPRPQSPSQQPQPPSQQSQPQAQPRPQSPSQQPQPQAQPRPQSPSQQPQPRPQSPSQQAQPRPQSPSQQPAPQAQPQPRAPSPSQPPPQSSPFAAPTQPYFPQGGQTEPSFPPVGAGSPGGGTEPSFPPTGGTHPLFPQSHASDPAWAQSRGGIPQAKLVESESSPIEQIAGAVGEVPSRFVAFLKISAKRAFRLRIEPSEVLPDERDALAGANPPITEPNLQAFLSWRRSVVFLVATILTVLSIMGLWDSLGGYKVATSVRFVKLLPTLAECLFCVICWLSLRNWTHWRKQRRWLFIGWLFFMLTPFAVFIYPLRLAVESATHALSVEQMKELGYFGVYNRVVAPFAFAMIAVLQLAPKVISLMPGLIRSSMVIKLLFPGASAPGWLIVMAAPLYAMIFYAILIIPYQFTASGWFIFGLLLVIFAQGLITRSGFALAKPLTQEEALKHITRVRKFYIVLLLTGLLSIVGGLGLLVKLLHMKWTSVVTTVLKFESNVMILTTIGADLVMTNLDRARGYTEGKEDIEAETELKIAAFVGLNAPPEPPPPGPAQ